MPVRRGFVKSNAARAEVLINAAVVAEMLVTGQPDTGKAAFLPTDDYAEVRKLIMGDSRTEIGPAAVDDRNWQHMLYWRGRMLRRRDE